MKLLRISVALATAGLMAGCGGTTVSGTSASSPGGSTAAGSTASASSPTSTSKPPPTPGTSVSGVALASTMHKALEAGKSVKFSVTKVRVEGSTAAATERPTDTGELQLLDPMTGKYTDTSSAKRDLIVVAGQAYGYFKEANAWVKKSDSPDALETRYVVNYTSQLAQNDPRVVADLVSVGQAVVKGQTSVNGVDVTRYSVTAAFSALIDKQVSSMKAHGCDVLSLPSNRTSLERSKASNGTKQFTLDVYLDRDNRLIRYEDPIMADDRGTRGQTTYSEYGAAVEPKAPADAKTFADVRGGISGGSSSASATGSPAA